MRLVLIFSTLLLNSFSHQQVHSKTESTSAEKSLAEEILAKFNTGQEELNDFEKNVGLRQDLVLLIGSSTARQDFFNHSSEFVNLTSNSNILPRLTLNTRTKTEFMDFFILDEEDKIAPYISRVYFAKKIITSVSAVKLLLLVDFPSFDKQIDAILQRAAESIEDVEKFVDSIGLIVTQVQNGQQIKEVKGRLKNLANSPKASSKTTSIIDALHVQYEGNDDWNKLGFINNPTGISLSSHITKDLERVIYKSINFENHDSHDFVYSPCKNESRICESLRDLLKDKLVEEVNRNVLSIIGFYVSIEKQLHDFEKSYLYFKQATELFSSFIDRLANITNHKQVITNHEQFIEKIIEYLRPAIVDLPRVNFQLSANYAKYLVFLQGPDVPEIKSWLFYQFHPVHKYLQSSTQWYEFLIDLDSNILSSYEVQKDIEQYKKKTSKLLKKIEKIKGEKKNTVSLQKLLKSLRLPIDSLNLEDLEMTQLEEPKIEVLKNLLSVTLTREDASCKCNEESKKVTCIGSYVKMSDVSNYINSTCTGANVTEVFALYKVFFDHNLDQDGKEAHLVIIAPYWEVIILSEEPRSIYLNGLDVDECDSNWGSLIPRDGEDGKPGLPGGPAGYFLGIVKFVKKPKILYIYATGGKGGPGQVDNGGKAGAPGFGGKPGEVNIIGLKKPIPGIKRIVWEGAYEDYTCEVEYNNKGCPEYKITNLNRENRDEPKALKSVPLYESVNSYLYFLRENRIDNARGLLLEKFSELLADNEAVFDLYNVRGLIDKFHELEDQFWKLNPKISLLPDYRSILNHIKKYAEKLDNNHKDRKIVLRYMYTAVLSKIVNLENNVEAYLVVDLEGFWKTITSEAAALKDLTDIKNIKGYRNNYLQELNGKIEEAWSYVRNVVTPEIDNTVRKLDKKVELLIDETVKLQEAAQKEKKELIKKQESLKTSLILSGVFNGIKLASMFLNFLGPIGSGVGAVIGGVASVSEALLVDSSSVDEDTLLKLPSALSESLDHASGYMEKKKNLFKLKMSSVQNLLEDSPDQENPGIQKFKKETEEVQKKLELEMGKGKTFDPEAVNKLQEKIEKLSENLEEVGDKLENSHPKTSKVIGHITTALSIAETSVDIYGKISSQVKNIDAVSNLINSAEDKFQKLKKYENKIYETIIPVCKNIENNVNQLQKQLKGKSAAALIVSKWQIQNVLRDVSKEIKTMTEGFEAQKEFVAIFDMVQDGINIMIDLYDTIEEYRYRAELGAYIANINMHTTEKNETKVAFFNEAINELMPVIQNNVVLHNYKIATNVVKHRVFPFAHAFFDSYKLPEILKPNSTSEIGTEVAKELKKLKNHLTLTNSTTNDWDKYVKSNIFGGRKSSLKPFYIWKYSEHKNDIVKLLKGEKVVLKADIERGFKENAVKFNRIGIYFASTNKTIERNLEESLQAFRVTMIHLGFSYYKCDDRIYMIASANQTIEYSIDRSGGCNNPVTFNDIYRKIADNEPVLSPYTTWQIQLKHEDNDFDEISKFASEIIDLELVGMGKYVDLNLPQYCNDQLDKYYARYDYQNENQVHEKTPELKLKSVIDDLLKGNILDNKYQNNWYFSKEDTF
ncbi:hypothetical protein TKK_0015041 [Trichogramma kaykai]|uniref:Uncharacterized protein n=1 Tax=Trichogramma kaykai TaxID=54128 RepID=A0ABD2WBQ3_9HYME